MMDYVTYLILRIFGSLLGLLPLEWALCIGRCLGQIAFVVVRGRRAVALRNLHIAFGQEKTSRELETIARKTFSNMGMNFIEFLRIPKLTIDYYHQYAHVEGWEHLDRAVKAGKGVIALTFHFGNWEIPALGASFFGYSIVALAQKIRNPWIDRYVLRTRQAAGVTILPKRRVSQEVVNHLREGRIVAIFVDQRERKKSQVVVDFFGKKTPSTPSPVVFALRSGAPMIPLFTIREDCSRHHVIIGEPLLPETTRDIQQDLRANVEAYTRILERMIRKHPDQYFWLHNRWGRERRKSRRRPRK